ncbi:hypothetical protein LCM20_08905 [Halobacillus litoralis]|uniref:hypothetical protein n=1 Tax=Halobacillus litoralis TaxID=45668 RepID=UPI001CD22ECA|nr:hypothetical protein [Halobacillus litoralis]MCA0970705.1 hypothetical protein [Halobacillus litoralis]
MEVLKDLIFFFSVFSVVAFLHNALDKEGKLWTWTDVRFALFTSILSVVIVWTLRLFNIQIL